MPTEGKRDPSSHRTPAQVRKQVNGYNARPENVKKRTLRNQARADMKERHGAAAIAGKDVHHKRPVRSGGGNSPGNLAIADRSKNRGWRSEK